MPLLEGLDGVEKMSKSKGNYIGITEDANSMFAKLLSISDALMWRWFDLLSFRPGGDRPVEGRGGRRAQPQGCQGAAGAGDRHPLPQRRGGRRRRGRFRQPRAEAAFRTTFPRWRCRGAPLAIGALLKQAGLAPSTSEAMRLIDQGGVRIDGAVVSDKGLKLGVGTLVVQVGKRKFARVTLAA
jgi:tyrosyl-tRNA synthetase